MTVKNTVISHFWNNEWIMPFWLRHHVPLFEHGIMINHGASDRSVAIINELAPHWEVRETSLCKDGFIAELADKEVMAAEEEVSGWKMVLNVTEFLLLADLNKYIQNLPENIRGVTTSGVVLIDIPQSRYDSVTEDPIFFQKTNGYFEYELGKRPEDYGIPGVNRSRLLHCHPNGKYDIGRHVSHVDHVNDPGLFLVWTGWAPYEKLKVMKYAVQTRIPESEFRKGFSVQHQYKSLGDIEQSLLVQQARAHDLLIDKNYVAVLKKLGYGGG